MAGGIYNPFGFGGGEVPQPVPRRMPQDIPAAPFGFAPPPSKWDQVKQALWETNINAPIRGVYNLMNADPYTLYSDTGAAGQQAATDSFDAGGGITVGSAMIPKPSNALSMGIKAYHGSPHSFDQFSMDKIGTGEGAQAYGHGLYFAENEGVAKGYRDTLSNRDGSGYATAHLNAQNIVAKVGGDAEYAASVLRDQIAGMDPNDFNAIKLKDTLDVIETGKYAEPLPPAGSMYEVNINADPDQFLDYDKPLSEQPETVKGMLARLPGAPDQSVWPYTTGNDLYEQLRVDAMGDDAFMQPTPQRLAARKAAAPEVSKVLGEAGIPGIKYLDAGSRGKGVAHVQPMYKGQPYGDPVPATAWNQVDQLTQRYKDMGYDVEVQDLGTRNFVVFDDKLISIVKKYGIAGASAMLGYNLLEGINPAQADELKRIEAGK